MRPACLAACLLASLPSIATAQTIAEDASAEKTERRVDTRIGLLTGHGDVGDVDGPSTGVHASLGYRLGDATFMAEYGYLKIGDSDGEPMSRDGRMSRAGAALRWRIADVAKPGSPVGLEFWTEAGAGIERVTWQRGGVLTRPDLALGFGFEIDGRGWRQPRPRHFGAYVGFRATVARAPGDAGPAMCEGPCTEATPPSRNDVSLYFHFGLHWGR
jgi:hypothetical protein